MENKQTIKGYKIFHPDFTCTGCNTTKFQFEENKEYIHEGKLQICKSGFHFCLKAQDCFNYYNFDPNNIVCEVEALGEVQYQDGDSKACTNHIKIGKRLTWQEVLNVANTGKDNTGHSNSGNWNSGDWNSGNWNSGNWNSGDWNSGNWNSGNRNSGNRNSGNSNSGDWNSGNWNSGNWNSGNWNSGNRNSGNRNSGNRNSGNWNSGYRNSGYRNSGNWNSGDRNSGDSNSGYRNSGAFCTDPNPKILLFNNPSRYTAKEWEQTKAVELMYSIDPTIWVPWNVMTEEERKSNPKLEASGGYTKSIPLKEAWVNAWGNWDEENRKIFTSLENFDADIFFEITGIRV